MVNSMAVILRNVIRNGGMPLTQVSERIETMYLNGRIDAEERLELTELMHEKADPANEAGDYREMYQALAVKYNELEARVEAAERAIAILNGEDGAGGEGSEENEIPEWQMWDGVSGGYAYGDIVMHGGRYWVSEYEGAVNVWEPGAAGVDDRYWREITAEEAAQRMSE